MNKDTAIRTPAMKRVRTHGGRPRQHHYHRNVSDLTDGLWLARASSYGDQCAEELASSAKHKKSHVSTSQIFELIQPIIRKAPVLSALLACLLQLPAALGIDDPSDPFAHSPEQTVTVPLPLSSAPPLRSFTRHPLRFERNDGQTDSSVAFVSRGRGHTLFLAKDEVVMALHSPFPQGAKSLDSSTTALLAVRSGKDDGDEASRPSEPCGVLRMRLAGAHRRPAIDGQERLRATANYFIGNEPALWRTNIPMFGKVHYREVYPGIDLIFYGNEGQLEYDFVVAPSADPNQILMEFESAEDLRVDPCGDLVLKVGKREVRWQKPLIYQEWNGGRREIVGTYRIGRHSQKNKVQEENVQSLKFVSFTLAGYNPALPLVIDPRLVYSSYLGGSGWDYGHDLATDGQGNVYMTGIAESLDFPTKAALRTSTSGGKNDAFVAKFNPVGELLFSTYLGGSGNEDALNAASRWVVMALTPTGDCYVAGGTDSLDFPLVKPLQTSLRGKSDAFVTALKSDGSALLFSTYLGGSKWDGANGIAIGPGDDVFIVGGTESSNFPTTNAFQPRISTATGNNGYQEPDAFITRIEAGGKSIRYSTFYGVSTRYDRAWDVVVDAEGNTYVALVRHAETATTYGEQWVITKISADGSTRLFERRWPDTIPPFPASQHPWTVRLALAPNGRVVIAGQINLDGVSLPAINEPDPSIVSWNEVYVALFDATNGNYVSAVYLGGSGSDGVARVLVDAAGDIIVAGSTWRVNGEPSGFPVTDPLESGPVPGLSEDVFVAKFRSTDLSLVSSTLVGGPGTEECTGMALAPDGGLWLVGATYGQFPTTNGFQPRFAGISDSFLAKLSFGERLQISLAGQTLRISWPVAAAGFGLEVSDSLAPAPNWGLEPSVPVTIADQNVVTLEIGGSPKFFRLKKP